MDGEQKKFEPTAPDYKGSGVDIWKAVTKDDKKETYLKVKVLGGKTINCFKYTPKKKQEPSITDAL